MNTIISKSSVCTFLLIIFSLFIILNCSDSTKPDPDPPLIPPLSSVEMDLSSLTNSSAQKLSLGKTYDANSVEVGSNWTYAAGTVAFWLTVTNITFAIPTAAFAATINQDPEYLGDLRWKWTKNFMFNHTAELYGEINGSVVNWEMYISRTGGFQDFLWYTGESNIDGSGGTWTFNESPDIPVEYIEIEWNYSATGVGDLRYEVVKASAENVGSYILYEFDNNTDYNASCTLFNSVNSNMINIEWHRINHNGRVESSNYFGDDLWHCWDENRDNIDCP